MMNKTRFTILRIILAITIFVSLYAIEQIYPMQTLLTTTVFAIGIWLFLLLEVYKDIKIDKLPIRKSIKFSMIILAMASIFLAFQF